MSAALVGAGIGLIGGAGFWLISWTWARQRFTLMERIAPYLRDQPRTSRLLQENVATPFPTLARIAAPLLNDATAVLEKLGSTTTTVEKRLRQSGSRNTVEHFRLEQVAWATVGLAFALVLALASMARGTNPVAALLLVAMGAVLGATLRDHELSRAARRRQQRIIAELPDFAEMTALAVAAGENPVAALDRVSRISSGALAAEVADVVAQTRTGSSLGAALAALSANAASTELARFADSIVVATDRGTPLAEVLRSQAQDIRENSRQRLMEVGGSKEIAMMVPVVFMILPVTVLFALFPGLAVLEVGL
ncbi:MAG: pilus assembly protein TadB [Actinobacteria bacterium]|nr:pilus assembly protein TadB [Actinomycetota bacterium]